MIKVCVAHETNATECMSFFEFHSIETAINSRQGKFVWKFIMNRGMENACYTFIAVTCGVVCGYLLWSAVICGFQADRFLGQFLQGSFFLGDFCLVPVQVYACPL